MDEIQWMAIDFRQERRLKIASCSVVSKLCAEAATKTFGYFEADESHPNCRISVENNEIGTHQSIIDSIVQRKKVSANISIMVRHQWQSLEKTFSVHSKEIKEFLKICRAVDDTDDVLPSASIKYDADDSVMREKKREMFNEYLERTYQLLLAEGGIFKDIMSETEVTSSLRNGGSRILSSRQQEASANIIHFNELGYGAFLHGKKFAGKTTTCISVLENWLQTSSKGREVSNEKINLGEIKMEEDIAELPPQCPDNPVLDKSRSIQKSSRKNPVLIVTPRSSLIKWLTGINHVSSGCKAKLWTSNQKVLLRPTENIDHNNNDYNGSCNDDDVILETDTINELDTDDTPDALLCPLEHLHIFLESEKEDHKQQNPSEKSLIDQRWSGVIVDIRGLNMESLNSSLLLSKRGVEEEMSSAIQRSKNVIETKVKQEINFPSSSSTTEYIISSTNIDDAVFPTKTMGFDSKGEEKHWLYLLSESLSPTMHNRCFISDDNLFDKSLTDGLLSFLLPQAPSIFSSGFTSIYEEISLTHKEDIIKRLNVELRVQPSLCKINEEIFTVDMGLMQHRKYSIVLDHLKGLEAFEGSNIDLLAKALVVLRRLCFHEDMVCINIQGSKDDQYLPRITIPIDQTTGAKTEPLILNDEVQSEMLLSLDNPECKLNQNDAGSEISSINQMLIEVKEELQLTEDNNEEQYHTTGLQSSAGDCTSEGGEASYFTVTSQAYTSDRDKYLRLGGGCLSSKLSAPLTFDMSRRFSKSHISSSHDLAEMSVEENGSRGDSHHAGVGSYKLQSLQGLLVRFADRRIVVTVETDEEMLIVHRYYKFNLFFVVLFVIATFIAIVLI
jgi:hypothetical protein